MKNYQITELCHRFVAQHVTPGSFCIDATAGNGNDTEFLCRLTGETGRVLAFDIQETAVERTMQRLFAHGLEQIGTVILDSHVNLRFYAEPETVDCILFNFGYLPGGDHAVATQPDTSVTAVTEGLRLLKSGGLMSLCIYSGGDTGFAERDALLELLRGLDSRRYMVLLSCYYNRPNHPPIPAWVLKL